MTRPGTILKIALVACTLFSASRLRGQEEYYDPNDRGFQDAAEAIHMDDGIRDVSDGIGYLTFAVSILTGTVACFGCFLSLIGVVATIALFRLGSKHRATAGEPAKNSVANFQPKPLRHSPANPDSVPPDLRPQDVVLAESGEDAAEDDSPG